MSDKLRVAVIGTGYFARFQIEAWQRLAAAELVALCDRDSATLQTAAQQAPSAAGYSDAEHMLDDVKPDLVDIATPPDTHSALLQAAAKRGLNCICQKPLAATLAAAEKLVQYARQAGITLAVHENFRFMPWHQEMARLIAAGQLGRLHSIAMRLRPGDGQGRDAYLKRQPYFQTMERFLIHETAIHFIDTFRFLCGEVTGVFARLRRLNPAIQGEDAGYVIFEFDNGSTGLFDGNRLNDHVADDTRRTMGEMWLEGERGVLRLDGMGKLWFKPHGEAEIEHLYDWQDIGFAGDCVYRTQKHFVDHFIHDAPLHNSGENYLRNMVIEEAIYNSAILGRWVPV